MPVRHSPAIEVHIPKYGSVSLQTHWADSNNQVWVNDISKQGRCHGNGMSKHNEGQSRAVGDMPIAKWCTCVIGQLCANNDHFVPSGTEYSPAFRPNEVDRYFCHHVLKKKNWCMCTIHQWRATTLIRWKPWFAKTAQHNTNKVANGSLRARLQFGPTLWIARCRPFLDSDGSLECQFIFRKDIKCDTPTWYLILYRKFAHNVSIHGTLGTPITSVWLD